MIYAIFCQALCLGLLFIYNMIQDKQIKKLAIAHDILVAQVNRMNKKQHNITIEPFETFFDIIAKTDTSQWKDGEIRPILGDFAINKEKTFVFRDGKRIMNLLTDRES